jgi:hypothetical protein
MYWGRVRHHHIKYENNGLENITIRTDYKEHFFPVWQQTINPTS